MNSAATYPTHSVVGRQRQSPEFDAMADRLEVAKQTTFEQVWSVPNCPVWTRLRPSPSSPPIRLMLVLGTRAVSGGCDADVLLTDDQHTSDPPFPGTRDRPRRRTPDRGTFE